MFTPVFAAVTVTSPVVRPRRVFSLPALIVRLPPSL